MRMELDVRQPLVLPPGPGPKALRDELTVSEMLGPSRAVPHVHRQHADAFYVLEGAIDFAGRPLQTGGFGLADNGVVHWFVAEEARILNIHAPGTWWIHRFSGITDGETIDSFDPPADATGDPIVVPPGQGELLEDDGSHPPDQGCDAAALRLRGRRRAWVRRPRRAPPPPARRRVLRPRGGARVRARRRASFSPRRGRSSPRCPASCTPFATPATGAPAS